LQFNLEFRVIEGVFERLIEWAAAALETSSNQPVLPCAIIALNATEITIEPELWDVETATSKLLESLSMTVHQNAAFQKYAEFWKTRNRQVDTLEQLVLCYYSSIKVRGFHTYTFCSIRQCSIIGQNTEIGIDCAYPSCRAS
jgi:uncharacterized protein (DUF1778 family)